MNRLPRWSRRLLMVFTVVAALATGVYLTRAFWFRQLRVYFIGSAYVAAEHFTRDMPEIDGLEICQLGGPKDAKIGDFDNGLERFPIVRRVELRGESARRIAQTFRYSQWVYGPSFIRLCHVPSYGLSFWKDGMLIRRTSICWRCGNFALPVLGTTTYYPFDRDGKYAQELLAEMHAALPDPAVAVPAP